MLLRCGVLAALICGFIGHARSDDTGGNSSSATDSGSTVQVKNHATGSTTLPITSTLGNGTCPSRTANYITHTLPQQCLRTDRVSLAASTTTTTDSGASSSGTTPDSSTSNATDDTSSAPNAQDASTSQGSADSTTSSNTEQYVPSGSPTLSEPEGETDSPLDNANFLSFEEWKKQNLAKIEADQSRNIPISGDRQRPGINNALDSFGDEGEIELDFSGFGGAANGPSQHQAAYRSAEGIASDQNVPSSPNVRSKDAGKTCKERTNYASFDCAATILKNNPECKSASSVLVENKDSYMLNTCSAQNKFFIVELCNDILIDTVVLANYEFFSSIFRHFRVSVSDRYPVKVDKWRDLGTFEARNTREVQAFLIEHPQIWARYLRIEFLTHYGSEYYCPLSLLRVHGTTMLEEIRPQEEIAPEEAANEEATLDAEATATPPLAQESASATNEIGEEKLRDVGDVEVTPIQTGTVAPEDANTTSVGVSSEPTSGSTAAMSSSLSVNATMATSELQSASLVETTCSPNLTSVNSEAPAEINSTTEVSDRKHDETIPKQVEESNGTHAQQISTITTSTGLESTNASTPSSAAISASEAQTSEWSATNATATNTTAEDSAAATNFTSTSLSTASASANNSTNANSTRTLSTASTASSPGPAQPQPSTQESFFKSISKRLQQLESNSTLSLQYIEEQSRILRDAFSKVEKRQISTTSTFLTNLNETVMKELHGFRQAYDQLWQSTVIELEGQREQNRREMLALSSRLTMVADELVWQKRMGIVQSTLLLLCLGLVLFARAGNSQGYLEVPVVMQQMMNKSSAALSRAGWESPPASPSP